MTSIYITLAYLGFFYHLFFPIQMNLLNYYPIIMLAVGDALLWYLQYSDNFTGIRMFCRIKKVFLKDKSVL